MMKQQRFFIACKTEDATEDWPMCSSGRSAHDLEDWSVSTNGLKADEIPEAALDAKSFSELVAGLLNAYYNDVQIVGMPEHDVQKLGLSDMDSGLTPITPEQPGLPF